MKKTIVIILAAAFFIGCKKNSSGPASVLISKVYENGDPEEEYLYNSAGQLAESKYYKEEQGAIVLGGYTKYIYDAEGKLTKHISYSMPSNAVSTTCKYMLDGAGRLSRSSYYDGDGANPGDLYLHIDHKFNGDGKIIRQTWKSPDEKTNDYRDFTYYNNGNLKSVDAFTVSGLATEKFYSLRFGPSDTTLPASFGMVTAMPVNYYYSYIISNKVESFTYNNNLLSKHSEIFMSERQFNNRGLVTKQKRTTKHILPASADEVMQMQFEYTQF